MQSSSTSISPTPSSIVRPRTTSTYSEYILGLETSNNSIHYSTASSSSSIKSQQSAESRLTLQSLASTNNNHDLLLPSHQSTTLSRLAAESASATINQPRYFSVSCDTLL
jgi:hypothetical protein